MKTPTIKGTARELRDMRGRRTGQSRSLRDIKAPYPIGTRFTTRGKSPRVCIVVDVLTTHNSAGAFVERRYIAAHEFAGQTILDRTVTDTTIAMGLIAP